MRAIEHDHSVWRERKMRVTWLPNGIFPPLQHDIQPYLSKLLTHHLPPCVIPTCRFFGPTDRLTTRY
ncbi:hypothetical protein COLO4_05449 [Corchorus olitorius]|uniref:Uncharacterized protein n=1 Tax=Corchorus olitorius TaxID=93759 RepID=A0A1R3KQU5_9ROSI|nr:hypothetical protein COLO4_05449 [Corchorus olitorius]